MEKFHEDTIEQKGQEIALGSHNSFHQLLYCAKLQAKVVLEDGREFKGYSFGYIASTSGEMVFNTGMVGYPESLTDPSYHGQVLVLTYPLIGNYGVAADEYDEYGIPSHFEGDQIHVRGLIVADYSFNASHYSSQKTLSDWLKQHKIPAIAGVDTRAITKHIREHGTMLCKVVIGESDIESIPLYNPNQYNLVDEVSHKEIRFYQGKMKPNEEHPKRYRIVVVDCGLKLNIIRHLLNQSQVPIELMIVPWNHPFGDLSPREYDGLFLSNGPGDPKMCVATIENIRKVMKLETKPIFGICLGNQLLGLAAGANTYKMKFGNRGMNQPVIDLRTTRCYITPQNHGFAIDGTSLPLGWKELFINANDKSNEGITHISFPWFSVQFHPEACGGPTDTWFLFEQFLRHVSHNNRAMPVVTIPFNLPCQRRRVLVLGSGGLSIGQAGEFDYSGSQAIKALKEANIEVILINPNIATVQTSSNLADRVYFLPVLPTFIERVIRRERPDGLLCGFGGQTALNSAVELHKRGILAKYSCSVLGTSVEAIIATEDRDTFTKRLLEVGEKSAPAYTATTIEECIRAANQLGYPVLVRATFTLGGLGSGFAEDEEALIPLCTEAFNHASQILIDKSLRGWKEIEYEVVRDCKDNCITVCNMENFDPLGIHTGDSIVISPSQTLSNDEFYKLREVAIKVIRHFQIVGECNIQYAVDPHSSTYFIVEVNARLSRSSALASKATGYPLAYVAAKLALGYDLLQIRNAVTKSTSACFEPALDYVVTKIPRWDLGKFAYVDCRMGSSMKSVGEVMAIGRTFEESFQKALRMIDGSIAGFDCSKYQETSLSALKKELKEPSPARIWAIGRAFQMNLTVDEIHFLTGIDRWFLCKLHNLSMTEKLLSNLSLKSLRVDQLQDLKRAGYSDRQIAMLVDPTDKKPTCDDVRQYRHSLGVRPVVKQIDTLAGEFPAVTNYLYLTYQGDEHDVKPIRDEATTTLSGYSPRGNNRLDDVTFLAKHSPRGRSVQQLQQQSFLVERVTASFNNTSALDLGFGSAPIIVLGCGCYRIGSSVEFDWTAMSCVRTLRSLGFKVVMVNCNPETVSTDYDESDRLFLEALDIETVLEIDQFEKLAPIIVSVGGQSPNNIVLDLDKRGVRILGTAAESIDQAEDRNKFSALCDSLHIDQPAWSAFSSLEAASTFATSVGYPVLVRPSYVLSGAAMRVVTAENELEQFLNDAALVSPIHPVVISKYITNAKEVELDAIAREGEILNYAISEHVENAGVHSGDATLILPAQKLYVETIRQVRKVGQKIAKALSISGPFNIQFMCKNNEVKVIECNLRASRTFPFISKTLNVDFIELATRVMVGAPVRPQPVHLLDSDFVGVKCSVFSFSRLRKADPILGVEMRSTGEVACFSTSKYEALLKALLAAGFKLPADTILLSLGSLKTKVEFLPYAKALNALGFSIYATPGTYAFLMKSGSDDDDDNDNMMTGTSLRNSFGIAQNKYEKQMNGSTSAELNNIQHTISQECIATENCFKNSLFIVNKTISTDNTSVAPNALDLINTQKISLVINVPSSLESRWPQSDGYRIRRSAVNCGVPLITDLKVAEMFVEALQKLRSSEALHKPFWEIRSWDEYISGLAS